MTIYKLPVPFQTPNFSMVQDFDGGFFELRVSYNDRLNCYYLDLFSADGTLLFEGRKIVEGVELVRANGNFAAPPGALGCVDRAGKGNDPTWENFGDTVGLYYFTADEFA